VRRDLIIHIDRQEVLVVAPGVANLVAPQNGEARSDDIDRSVCPA